MNSAPTQAPITLEWHYERSFTDIMMAERAFLALLLFGFMVAALTYQSPNMAMWVGFAFASYSVVANDSIQTIGTFMASNSTKKWWMLWLFIGGLFLLTVGYSWFTNAGDVTFGRLGSKGFEQTPTSFTYLQITAPLFLLILTRMKMPVSTTFLILSCFAATASTIGGVLIKSLSGYAVAFGVAIAIWLAGTRLMESRFKGEAHPGWTALQWITSGTLWSVWIMQDAANVAVYLPRQLSGIEFLAFGGLIFCGLGVLFYLRGDRIQEIVTEKAGVTDIRAATIIDIVYAVVLYVFKIVNNIPMSTTWVFLGLMAGREVAITLRSRNPEPSTIGQTARMVAKDAGYAGIGLLISLILAAVINPVIRSAFLGSLGLGDGG